MRITHVIIGLGDGGAEKSLYKLVIADESNLHSVISLTSEGKYGQLLAERGISVFSVRFQAWNPLAGLLELARVLRTAKPEILHGWMPHGAFVASIFKIWSGARRLFWSIRSSEYGVGRGTLVTRFIVRVLAMLSHTMRPRILVVGHRALENHVEAGFNRKAMVYVPNGYPPPLRRKNGQDHDETEPLTSELNRPVTKFGMVARYHPKKGHKVLLEALAGVKNELGDWILHLVGEGTSANNQELVAAIKRFDLTDRVILEGPVGDPERIYTKVDFHILPSVFGEGFPNVVAESMSLGVPNIVTDVGDSAEIVGYTGWVVPAADTNALKNAIEAALISATSERRERGVRASQRISQEFSLQRMVESHILEYSRRRIVAYPRYSRLGASSRVRMFQFEDALADAGWEVRFFPFSDDHFLRLRYEGRKAWLSVFLSYCRRLIDLRESRGADLVWVQRELIPWAPAWIETLLTPSRSPVIYDFDDAVHEQFRESPRAIIRSVLGKKTIDTVRKSSGVVVGNQILADFFRGETQRPAILVPSSIDTSKLYPSEQPTHSETRPFVFAWIGTPLTFETYVEKMLGEFTSIAKKLKAEFWVVGAGSEELSTAWVRYLPWSEETEPRILQSIDVGVMPLRDDSWSRGKCGYKLLQYMAVGKPVIASAVGVNVTIVNHGKNGFLVEKEGDWGRYLEVFAEDSILVSKMGKSAVESVGRSYSIERGAPKLVKFFGDAVYV